MVQQNLESADRFSTLRFNRFLRSDRRGATTIEFAMIGLAFFFMVMGIFTVGMDMFMQMMLDDAARAGARQVQVWGETGTASTGAQFAQVVCNEFSYVAPNCLTSLQYSVQVAPAFSQMTAVSLLANGSLSASMYGTWISGSFTANTITPTTSGSPEFMLVQVAYPLPFKFFSLAHGVATENGTGSIYSTAATVIP